ncbi:unnamed protein product [Brassica oleracea]
MLLFSSRYAMKRDVVIIVIYLYLSFNHFVAFKLEPSCRKFHHHKKKA